MRILLQTITQTPDFTSNIDVTWLKDNYLNIFQILSENNKLDENIKDRIKNEYQKIVVEHKRIKVQINKLNEMVDYLYSYEEILNVNVDCWGKLSDIENNLLDVINRMISLIKFIDLNINHFYIIGTLLDNKN